MNTVTLLYFARAAQITGCDRDEYATDEALALRELRDRVFARHSGLREFADSLLWAVDEIMADESTAVAPGQTVAVMPPFSGG